MLTTLKFKQAISIISAKEIMTMIPDKDANFYETNDLYMTKVVTSTRRLSTYCQNCNGFILCEIFMFKNVITECRISNILFL